MSDELKSAVEIAMERLNAGEDEVSTLSEEQKNAIAEIRNRYRARIAQAEISHHADAQKAAAAGDPAAPEAIAEKLRQEKQRLENKMEREVERIKD